MATRLLESGYEILYRKGRQNCQADAVSRLLSYNHTAVDPDEELQCLPSAWPDDKLCALDYIFAADEEMPAPATAISTEEILREQQEDPLCVSIREGINRRERIPFVDSRIPVSLFAACRGFHKWWYPFPFVRECCRTLMYRAQSGHPGGRKMYVTLRREFYWPSMSVDGYTFVRSCATCARELIKLRRK